MNFRLKNVYGRISEEERQALVRFWTELGVLSAEEAQKRSRQAVFLLLSGPKLVGVNTVYVDDLLFPDNPYYFYRTLIHPAYRRSYNLLIEMVNRTYDYLNGLSERERDAKGLALTIENPKLAATLSLARFRETGEEHILQRLGILYAGKNRFGQDLWYRNFT